jgi:hypothetical protein
MRVGTKRPVAHHEVARLQFVVHPSGPGQVVGPQRCRQRPPEKAGVGVEQDQQVGRGKAAARGLAARLAERLLQRRRVGHGEAGTIDQVDAVPVPAGRRVGSVVSGDGALELPEEGQGEPSASLAVGGIAEVQTAEVPEFGGGRVAVEDRAEEEVGGDDRGEGAPAERVVEVAADLANERLGDDVPEVALDAAQGLRDSKHRASGVG